MRSFVNRLITFTILLIFFNLTVVIFVLILYGKKISSDYQLIRKDFYFRLNVYLFYLFINYKILVMEINVVNIQNVDCFKNEIKKVYDYVKITKIPLTWLSSHVSMHRHTLKRKFEDCSFTVEEFLRIADFLNKSKEV